MGDWYSRITAVIVTYDSREIVGAALDSIDRRVRIIVVDNASGDGTGAFVRSKYPHVEVIENERNVGFGRANNIGLALVRTEFAVLINPDVYWQGSAVFTLMLAAARRYPDAALLSPTLMDDSRSSSGIFSYT